MICKKYIFLIESHFLAAENLLKSEDPVWKEGFTECGKWMDGWESRRKVRYLKKKVKKAILNLNIYKYFLTYVKAHGSKYDEILILAYSWSRLVHHPPWQLAPGWPNSRVQPQYGLFHR